MQRKILLLNFIQIFPMFRANLIDPAVKGTLKTFLDHVKLSLYEETDCNIFNLCNHVQWKICYP